MNARIKDLTHHAAVDRVLLTLLLGAACWAAYGPAIAAEPLVERKWTIEGTTRQALVYLPEHADKILSPLVFVFHGHGGSMANAARSFHLHDLWPEAVVVYMQGLPTPGRLSDPEGKRPGWQHSAGMLQDRDLKFVDVVFESMKSDVMIDVKRVYATGHSNGGGFTYLLWAARGELFAAVATSSAVPTLRGNALAPKPALHLAGQRDPLVKFEWQQVAMNRIRTVNGCKDNGRPWASSGTLTGTLYPSEKGTPVVTLLHPGGHRFPAEAPALIVRFFKNIPVN